MASNPSIPAGLYRRIEQIEIAAAAQTALTLAVVDEVTGISEDLATTSLAVAEGVETPTEIADRVSNINVRIGNLRDEVLP